MRGGRSVRPWAKALSRFAGTSVPGGALAAGLVIAIRLGVAAWLVAPGPDEALAAFEVRPLAPVAGPHFPGRLPAPFSWEGRPARVRLGALHLGVFSLPDLRYDAAAIAVPVAGLGLRCCVGRLGLGSYAEWEIAAGLSGKGASADLSVFLLEPGEDLRRLLGAAASRAGSLSFSWERDFGRPGAIRLGARDALRAGEARFLAIDPAPWVELEAGRGPWRAFLSRIWERGAASSRVGISYRPDPRLSLGHAWSPGDGSRADWVNARAGFAGCAAWSSIAAGLPPSCGVALFLGTDEAPSPPARSASSKSAISVAAVPDSAVMRSPSLFPASSSPSSPASSPVSSDREDPAWDDLDAIWDELDLPVIADGGLLTSWGDSDSLGARCDSLEREGPGAPGSSMFLARAPRSGGTKQGRGSRSGAAPQMPTAPAERRNPIPLDVLSVEEVVGLASMPSDSAALLSGLLRRLGGPGLASASTLPSAFRRPLLRLAPYLTRPAPALAARMPLRGARNRLLLQRTVRVRPGSGPAAADLLTLRRGLSEPGWEARLRFREDRPDLEAAGHGALLSRRGMVVAGRGGDPLLWGTGLTGRGARVVLTREGSSEPRSEDAGSSRLPPSALSAGARLLSPSLSGDRPFAGFDLTVSALRLVGTAARDEGAAAVLGEISSWRAGYRQGLGAGIPPQSLWVRHRSPGEEVSVEGARTAGGEWAGALRWTRSRRGRTGAWDAWWDLLLHHPLSFPRSGSEEEVPGAGPDAPLVRRLRGGFSVGRQSFSGDIRSSGRRGPLYGLRARSGVVRGQGAGVLREDWRWSLRAERTGQDTWPAGLEGTTGLRRVKVRLRGTLELRRGGAMPVRALRSALGSWGAEAGLEERTRVSDEGASVVRSHWAGLYRSGRSLRFVFWTFGVLEASAAGTSLEIAPVWGSGARASVRGRALHAAGTVRARAGSFEILGHVIWPCWRDTKSASSAGSAEVALRIG